MDIYSFLNSSDIAEHCRNIKHQFNVMETAFIINRSKKKAIKEKHAAYLEIINTMPDMEITERFNCQHYSSLHDFLKKYIDVENNALKIFQSDEGNVVYKFTHYYEPIKLGGIMFKESEADTPYSTLESVLAKMKIAKDEDDEINTTRFKVVKQWMDSEKRIIVYFTPNFEPVNCDAVDYLYQSKCEYEYNIFSTFDGFWIEIPTPFKKGDIVIGDEPICSLGKVFVLEHICYWEQPAETVYRWRNNSDSSDMLAYGYWLDEDGGVCYECMHAYQNLEYYRGELVGMEHIYKAVSSHMRGEIGYELLLDSYYKMRTEKQFEGGIYMGPRYPNESIHLEWLAINDSRKDG